MENNIIIDRKIFLDIANEYYMSYTKLGNGIYKFNIEDNNIDIFVKKVNRSKYVIYQNSEIIATIKNPYFGKKKLFYNNMIDCLLIKDGNIIYIPPKCLNIDGFNSFVSKNIKELNNYDILNENSKIVTYKNEMIFIKYNETKINNLKTKHYIVRKPLNIIQGITLALILK